MDLSIAEAYKILQLSQDASKEDIISNFKKLALEYHPDKHSQTEESFRNFHLLCDAFQKLTKKEEKERKKPLTVKRMFQLFEEVFFGESTANQNGYPYFNPDSGDDDDGDDSCDEDHIGAAAKTTNQINGIQNYEIVTEDVDKDKKKAAKRKAKKKKRKEKKKQDRELSQLPDDNDSVKFRSDSDDDSKSEEELDPSSAFAMSISRNKSSSLNRNNKNDKFNKEFKETNDDVPDEVNSTVLRSRNLAIRGNDLASLHKFKDAVAFFSDAIKLNPKDFRFYGNRSFCYDKLEQFDKALKDAEKAIQLNANWPKNYFRKGRALAGMKKFGDAEEAFELVLKLDPNCDDAEQELLEVRTRQVMELGFIRQQAIKAIKQHKTVQAAVDSLLMNSDVVPNSLSEVYLSDDDSHHVSNSTKKIVNRDIKMDPSNPEGLASLWIGNISKDVKEKTLKQLFSTCGTVISLRLLPEKFCAFVNFADKVSAGRAMKDLQGALCCGQRLLIRFPDKMGTNCTATTSSPNYKKTSSKPSNTVVSSVNNKQVRASGPVKDGECYFWRTTGCIYGDNCRYKHVKEHKGVDWRFWHKT